MWVGEWYSSLAGNRNVGGLRVVGKLATSRFYKEAIHIPWDQISRDVHVQKVKACQLICDFIKFLFFGTMEGEPFN